jgi:hypothetical protein
VRKRLQLLQSALFCVVIEKLLISPIARSLPASPTAIFVVISNSIDQIDKLK